MDSNSSNGTQRITRSTSPSPLKSRHRHRTTAAANACTSTGSPIREGVASGQSSSGSAAVRPCTLTRSSSQPEQSVHGVSPISASSNSVLMMVMGSAGAGASAGGVGESTNGLTPTILHGEPDFPEATWSMQRDEPRRRSSRRSSARGGRNNTNAIAVAGSLCIDTTSSNSTIGALNIMSVSDSVTQIPSVTLNTPRTAAAMIDPIERQSLKHLSVSAPAIKSAVIMGTSSSDNEFIFAPTTSKSRQKKFHRHFSNVPQEEKVLDYYSCALVADILLQGYLYITENYFAFYSNVFGYVTKLLIPVSSIVTISKEKTAKIIPNAVGVCTRNEKHVFASLISRETTYKLMFKVWTRTTEIGAKTAQINSKVIPIGDTGSGADLSIPDESSNESGSGNDSAGEPLSFTPSPLNTPNIEKIQTLGSSTSTASDPERSCVRESSAGASNNNIADNDKKHVTLLSSTNPIVCSTTLPSYVTTNPRASIQISSRAGNTSSLSKESGKQYLTTIRTGLKKTQNGQSLLIIATALLVILFLSAAMLLNRISSLQDKLAERPVFQDSDQFYQELLTYQNKLHSSSADEIHQYINMNLKQIVKVRQSLEALSFLVMTSQPIISGVEPPSPQQSDGSQVLKEISQSA